MAPPQRPSAARTGPPPGARRIDGVIVDLGVISAEEYLQHVIDESPQKRLIEAREVAALSIFLMSPEARGITGQSLNVCGGMIME